MQIAYLSNGKPNRRWGVHNKMFCVTPFELFNTLVSMFPSLHFAGGYGGILERLNTYKRPDARSLKHWQPLSVKLDKAKKKLSRSGSNTSFKQDQEQA